MTLGERFKECVAGPWETGGDDIQFCIEDDGSGNLRIFFQYTDVSQTRDIINDVDFPKKLYRDEKKPWYVHGGFARGFKSVIDIIGPRIATTKSGFPASSIYIAGYSAGGAYATLLCEWCFFHGWRDVECWTFGAPRVLFLPSNTIKQRFQGLHRVYDFRDIFVHLPPWIFGFEHVGNPIRVGGIGWPSVKDHGNYYSME